MNKQWICTAKRQVGKLSKDASAEVVKHETMLSSDDKEITMSFVAHYTVNNPNGLANRFSFKLVS